MWLLDQAGRVTGLIEEKFAKLRELGVFAESARIHAAYVDLAGPPAASLEALKRAIFLGWYEQVEPGCFTGVFDLDPAANRRAIELLDAALADRKLDSEFAAMLGWYWSLADYYFADHSSDRLRQYLSQLQSAAVQTLGLTRASLEGRGEMGHYWISVLESSASRRFVLPN